MQTTTCRAHDRNTGQPCNNPSHANTGLCSKHGGPAVEKSIQINTKHGLFARIVPQPLAKVFQDARNNPNPLHLLDEIALLRTFLAHYLANFQDNQPITAEDLERVGRQVDRISRLTVRQSRLLAEAPDRVSREDLSAWTSGMRDVMLQVLREFVPASSHAPAAQRLDALMAERDLTCAPPEAAEPLAGATAPTRPEPVDPVPSDPALAASDPPQPASRLHLQPGVHPDPPQAYSRLSTLDSLRSVPANAVPTIPSP